MKKSHPKSLFRLFFVLLIAISYSNCKKDVRTQPQNIQDPEIAQAKSWYESSFSINNSQSGSKSLNSVGSSKFNLSAAIKPDWQHTSKYSRFSKNVIEMPADSGGKFGFDLKNMTTSKAYSDKKYSRTSLLIMNSGGNYQAFVMMVLADPSYVKNDLSKLANNSYRKHDADFSGMVMYFTPTGNYVGGYSYKNGQLISPASNGATSGGQKIQSVSDNKLKTNVAAVQDCTDWYLDTYEDGVLVDSEYIGTTCDDVGGSGGTSGGSSGGSSSTPPTAPPPPCSTAADASVGGHITINVAAPPPGGTGGTGTGGSTGTGTGTGTGDGGFPPPSDECSTGDSTPDFGEDDPSECLNCRVLDDNFDDLLNYAESTGLSISEPFNTTLTVNGVNYSGQITQIYNSAGQVVAAYFSPDVSSGPFQTGTEYSVGNGEVETGLSTGNAPSDYPEFGSPGFNTVTSTATYSPQGGSSGSSSSSQSEGFLPLCKSSIVLTPSSSNSSEVNMTAVHFGITDLPHFPFYKTEVNVITFNLYISIPNQIVNPTNPKVYFTITPAMQREFIYQAYHFASEQTNIAHGDDFFSASSQPKYSALFASFVQFYLNNIALQGLFPTYESSHSGLVPSIGARASTLINPAKASPAVYTTGASGEGC